MYTHDHNLILIYTWPWVET